jgi:hypothetical protein
MDIEILEEVTQNKYPLDIWTEEESLIRKLAFSNGAKWMQERMFNEQDMIDFADWYCNGLSNVERKTPEEMYPKYTKIRQEIIKNK